MEIGEKAMATEKNKGTKWDGKSRVSNDLYRKRHDEIFKKIKRSLISYNKNNVIWTLVTDSL